MQSEGMCFDHMRPIITTSVDTSILVYAMKV